MPQQQYNPKKTITNLGGHIARKFGESSAISVIYDNPRRAIKKNLDGGGRHVEYLDDGGTITLTLGENSPTNSKLMLAHDSKLQFSVVIIDKTHIGSNFASSDVMVQTVPGFMRNKDPEDMEWVLQFTTGKITHTEPKEVTLVNFG